MKAMDRLGAVLTVGVAVVAVQSEAAGSADKREVYTSTAGQKTLLDKALPGIEGKKVIIMEATFPPGWVGGRHYHSGPVYVYILRGALTVDEAGKSRQTFEPGEIYEEPIGTTMQARNVSASEPTQVLLIQVSSPGEPLMYKAE